MDSPSQQNLPEQPAQTIGNLLSNVKIKERFNELLGKNASGFITSILQVVNNNNLLKNADPQTIITAAATAAVLKLPIDPNLGFAYIVPYNKNVQVDGQWTKVQQAQFQIGWKGFVQLAQRTAQYKNINVIPVYDNQFKSFNQLTEELDADLTIEGIGESVGYVGYFRTLSGFEKTVYWSRAKVTEHAKKFSKTFAKTNSAWKTNFDGMACKTIVKNMLSKWGILSIELNLAIQADQSVQSEEGKFLYPDNENIPTLTAKEMDDAKEKARILEFISGCVSIEQLTQVYHDAYDNDCVEAYEAKYNSLSPDSKNINQPKNK